jgi:octaheme c-type cytochrome (tetrathionate reductase family)
VALLLVAVFPVAADQSQTSSTADHSKLEELKGDFEDGPSVTRACLKCHTEAAKQLHQTTHWTWEFRNPDTRQVLGKKKVINNFCMSITSNYPRCTSCHIGYGWKDKNFDFSAEDRVDCLACHDTTGSYKKFPTDAGHPAYVDKPFPKGSDNIWKTPDLGEVARKVGKTQRYNCGNCHFFGGGGNAVKHGDLDTSLNNPDKVLDVHMDAKGLDFSCATCHAGKGHRIQGSRYDTTARDTHGIDIPGRDDGSRATCESCHGNRPHPETTKLNDHTDRVACQTCHIPAFARGGIATKTWWDWSQAGRLSPDGKPITEKNEQGHVIYDSKKGDFRWEENVIPEYRWFNGEIVLTQLGDRIDPNNIVVLNRIAGGYGDPGARIWPFKIMRGRQPYDTQSDSLVVTHVFGSDDTAFWGNFKWDKAIIEGMKVAGMPYSGQFDFVDTEMHWPITHMVAPKEDALACDECHSRNGRLDNLTGFYMPGRDTHPRLDRFGWLAVLLVLVSVLLHALVRIVLRKGTPS